MILFDAVGTILYPSPDVATAYCSVAHANGINLEKPKLWAAFKAAFRKEFNRSAMYCCESSENIERQKWQNVVMKIFGDQYDRPLFAELWNHFSLPGSWAVYEDARELICRLMKRNIEIGIASNFDSRLVPLINFHFPEISTSRIFYSTEVGFAKPDVRFYKVIETHVGCDRKQLVMIGDTFSNDVEAAGRAGWNAFLRSPDESLMQIESTLVALNQTRRKT